MAKENASGKIEKGGAIVNKIHVEINYSNAKGLIGISSGGRELDIAPIHGKRIDDWFVPSDSWKGLIHELRGILDDDLKDAELSFSFYGPSEYEQTFHRCLEQQDFWKDKDPKEEQMNADFRKGKKAEYNEDYEEALTRYLDAAESGHLEAKVRAAGILLEGKCRELGADDSQDIYRAAVLYQQAAEQGKQEAVKLYHKAAERGYADAQFYLGFLYEDGDDLPKDQKAAVEWYRKAAEQGHVTAQFMLARCYGGGDGVKRDVKKAAEWYRKAAEQGDDLSQWMLGDCYADGKGVPQDDEKAVEWYRRAAVQDNAYCQYKLGTHYADGKGVPQDDETAVGWYQKAAKQGNADALYSLGRHYSLGRGVPKDEKIAQEYYKKAAEKGKGAAGISLAALALKRGLGKSGLFRLPRRRKVHN